MFKAGFLQVRNPIVDFRQQSPIISGKGPLSVMLGRCTIVPAPVTVSQHVQCGLVEVQMW